MTHFYSPIFRLGREISEPSKTESISWSLFIINARIRLVFSFLLIVWIFLWGKVKRVFPWINPKSFRQKASNEHKNHFQEEFQSFFILLYLS